MSEDLRTKQEIEEAIEAIEKIIAFRRPSTHIGIYAVVLDALQELLERRDKCGANKGEVEVLPKPDRVHAVLEGVAYEVEYPQMNTIRLIRSKDY
jgi:hypothetical protein